jgi:plastocyanin
MRRLPISALVVVAAVIAACAAPAAPGWTYAPAPSATPAPSVAASGSPAASASASAPASAPASQPVSPIASAPAGSPGASAPAGGLTITAPVGAAATGFQPTTLKAAPGHAFTVTFDNQDAGVPHNWVVTKPDGSKVDIGDTTPFSGPGQKTYNVPSLSAGQYPFMCQVHPTTMKGILTIG